MSTPQPQIEWLTKDQAAKRLNRSTRTVLAMAAEGKIQRKRQLDPATRQTVVKLHAGDVERLAWQAEHPEEAPQSPQTEPRQALQAPRTVKAADPLAAALLQLLTAASAPATPAAPKAWMTLEEAEAYTGLSRALLVRLIHQGVLPALQDEPMKREGEKRAKPGSSWRVSRRDLDALQGSPIGGIQKTDPVKQLVSRA